MPEALSLMPFYSVGLLIGSPDTERLVRFYFKPVQRFRGDEHSISVQAADELSFTMATWVQSSRGKERNPQIRSDRFPFVRSETQIPMIAN